jgi:integration host factor subunit alpha
VIAFFKTTCIIKALKENIMATLTRIDLANSLRDRFGLTVSDAYKMIDIIFDEIGQSLVNNEEVKISGFGTFKILAKSARIGRNPKTGIPAVISARRVASFRPSTEFRKQVAKK